jgi:hypothetical protein
MHVPTPVLPPSDDPRYSWPERLWPATPEGVHDARHALVATLDTWGGEWGGQSLVDSAALVLTELMANAQRHAWVPGRSIGTTFHPVPAGVLIQVHDADGDSRPALADATADDEQGRGLMIVNAITHGQWGVSDRQGPGKSVWALITAAPPAPRNSR